MIKRLTLVSLFILVIGLVVAYVMVGAPPKTDTVRVVTPPGIIASLPVWIADKQQMFSRRHLDIQFINVTDSALMVEAMLAGNADVLPAVSLADLATRGGAGNLALMHVQIYSHSRMRKNPPFESILVTSGSSISTLRDLEGKVSRYTPA